MMEPRRNFILLETLLIDAEAPEHTQLIDYNLAWNASFMFRLVLSARMAHSNSRCATYRWNPN